MDYAAERRAVLETARQLAQQLTIGSSGNISQRIEGELLAITPSQCYPEDLGPEDIVVVDFEVNPIAGDALPSVETLLHIGIYQARPDVQAVIHSHSCYASALAVTGEAIPPILEDQMIFLGGQIEVARHAVSGSEELAGYAVEALGDRNACILANHGALVVGRDLRAAFYACHYLEKVALAFLLARAAGKVNVLAREVVEAEQAFFKMRRM